MSHTVRREVVDVEGDDAAFEVEVAQYEFDEGLYEDTPLQRLLRENAAWVLEPLN